MTFFKPEEVNPYLNDLSPEEWSEWLKLLSEKVKDAQAAQSGIRGSLL
jgi:hypothetical protein